MVDPSAKEGMRQRTAGVSKTQGTFDNDETTILNQEKLSKKAIFWGNGPITFGYHVEVIFGFVILMCTLPVTGVIVGLSVLWDAIDRGFQGRPQDGIVCQLARWWNKVTAPYWGKLMRNPADGFMVNLVLSLGVVVPVLFFLALRDTVANGFNLWICVAYHIIRLGPYFMNFAYMYTSAHKEGHSRRGMWAPFLNPVMRYVFNWWIGLFYGVMPSSFAVGHSINHHKYNNGPLDVVSTSDRPRDEFKNWVAYLPRFMFYATNVSTTRQFLYEGKYKVAAGIVFGTLYYVAFAAWVYMQSPMFAIAYVVYPLSENILLLSVVGWVWHAFIDPDVPDNAYVGSVTLYDGPINVMEEDLHVVHHQYPGIHWTQHPLMYKKHKDRGEYKENQATAFRKTHVFELFFFMILKDYKIMAEHFVDLSGKYPTEKEIIPLLKRRLRSCWWGPMAKKLPAEQKGWKGVEQTKSSY